MAASEPENYLDQLPEASLKDLTLKTCMLLALVTGKRGHALRTLTVEDVKTFYKNKTKNTTVYDCILAKTQNYQAGI